MTLKEFFSEHNKIALAFSGGVDSAYLLYAAMEAGAQVRAYYVRTAFQPEFEYQDACRLVKELGADMATISMNILEDSTVAANPKNRCYYCKNRIFHSILKHAHADGFTEVCDGTNASDDISDRPGYQALQEMHIMSPLRSCGLTKEEIRSLSKEAGLFTHDKPSYACLATRIPTGMHITEKLLCRTEWAEENLKDMGFTDFRVRTLGDSARIQIKKHQFPLIFKQWEAVQALLAERYDGVTLDMEFR